MKKQKIIISAFPGTGKSTAYRALKKSLSEAGIEVYDSDSSTFEKDKFPTNYVDYIEDKLQNVEKLVMFISSHEDVRKMLHKRGIKYSLVYPERELKSEYLERYKKRGSPQAFVNLLENKWDEFIDSCEKDPTTKYVLKAGEYIGDSFEFV